MKNNFYEQLVEYFKNKSEEQIQKDWDKTKEFDSIGPTINDYIKTLNFNHDRPLSDFEKQLDIIKQHGFNPIAVTQLYFEDTFVFKTRKEANLAYKTLEKPKPSKVVGWWYGIHDFVKEIKEYESEDGASKVLIHWL
jgi:hypothetical protein